MKVILVILTTTVILLHYGDKISLFLTKNSKQGISPIRSMLQLVKKVALPKEGSLRERRAMNMLMFSKLNVPTFYYLKYSVLVIAVITFFIVHHLNLSVVITSIRTDNNLPEAMRSTAFSDELFLFEEMKDTVIPSRILNDKNEIEIKQLIRSNIFIYDLSFHQGQVEQSVNKVYQSLKRYFQYERIDLIKLILLIFVSFQLPNIILFIINLGTNEKKHFEILALEQTFMLHGSLKSSNFNSMMNELLSDSHYYKSFLEYVKDNISREGSINLSDLSGLNDEEKLFFEKLIFAYEGKLETVVDRLKQKSKFISLRTESKHIKEIEIIDMNQATIFLIMSLLILVKMIYPFLNATQFNFGF
ncbi:MAG: hypothetical protein BGO41_01490 [Clostridiales bacterium 38-18]|nr:MAG: hypothetical protein BGO41_01490 [Clostridiales bacterium 38-18]